MKNVIVLPELRENLLSIKKLSQAGIDVLFSGGGAEFELNDEVIGEAFLNGNMYELELESRIVIQDKVHVAVDNEQEQHYISNLSGRILRKCVDPGMLIETKRREVPK